MRDLWTSGINWAPLSHYLNINIIGHKTSLRQHDGSLGICIKTTTRDITYQTGDVGFHLYYIIVDIMIQL